jgi:NAD(P)-dependent dehydrogenase (short-subunit alcohol dehydrogenase family)
MNDTTPASAPLAGRVILVTGAGRGIGRSAAIAFARAGARLILHGRDTPRLEAVYDEVTALTDGAAIVPLDLAVADDKAYAALAHDIEREFGRLDGILHNAVHGALPAPLAQETLDHWLTALRVNLAAPFALTRALLPLLRRAPDASIVATSDSHAHVPAAYWGAVAVAKAGLEAMVRIWAQELEQHPGLRINAIVPGPVDSPQRARTHPGESRDGRRPIEALMADYLYWIGPASRGRSGEIVSL